MKELFNKSHTESHSSLLTLTNPNEFGEFHSESLSLGESLKTEESHSDIKEVYHSIIEACQLLSKNSILLTKTVMQNLSFSFEIKEMLNQIHLYSQEVSRTFHTLRPLQFEFKFLNESVKRNLGTKVTCDKESCFSILDPFEIEKFHSYYTHFVNQVNESGLLEISFYESLLDFPELDTLELFKAASFTTSCSTSSSQYHLLDKLQQAEWKRVKLLQILHNSLICKNKELEKIKSKTLEILNQYTFWQTQSIEQVRKLSQTNNKLKQVYQSSSHLLQKANGISFDDVEHSDSEDSCTDSSDYYSALEDLSDLCIQDYNQESLDSFKIKKTDTETVSDEKEISFKNYKNSQIKRRKSMPLKDIKIIKRKGIKSNFKTVLYTSE